MEIRKYQSADCEEMAALFYETVHKVNARDYTSAQLDAWATGRVDLSKWDQSFLKHNTLVATQNGKILGFGDMDATGYLDRLYVHKDYQGRGIATAICDALETFCGSAVWTTHASITAKPFFLQRGYRVVREQQVVRNGIPLTNFVMEKKSILCPLSPEDQETMLEILTNDIIKQTYILPDFERKEDAVPLFRRIMQQSREDAHFVRGIFVGGELVGFLNDVEIENGTIELGYVIHPAHHGRGCATAALKAAIAALWEKGYRKVVCGAFSENPASIRVMEKAGMERLPKTEEIEYREKMHHCVYYGIKRGDQT